MQTNSLTPDPPYWHRKIKQIKKKVKRTSLTVTGEAFMKYWWVSLVNLLKKQYQPTPCPELH
jgi:hypothetical protein